MLPFRPQALHSLLLICWKFPELQLLLPNCFYRWVLFILQALIKAICVTGLWNWVGVASGLKLLLFNSLEVNLCIWVIKPLQMEVSERSDSTSLWSSFQTRDLGLSHVGPLHTNPGRMCTLLMGALVYTIRNTANALGRKGRLQKYRDPKLSNLEQLPWLVIFVFHWDCQ